jgi:hypothetical protein
MPNNTDEALTIVKPEVLGNVTGKKLIIHGTAFRADNDELGVYSQDGTATTPEADPMRCPLPLPQGVTITKIRWLISTNSSATCTMRIGSLSFTTGLTIVDDLSELTSGTTGARIVDSGVISIPLADGFAYFLEVDQSGSAGLPFTIEIHAVEITYDTPDCRNTI